jgi:PPOX class probable F420-dependent enzyme
MAADQLPDPDTDFGRSVRERLANEPLIWLTTISRNGTPQPNPVWFLHDGGDILIYNLHSATRLAHMRARPQVALNLNSNADGGGIVVITGLARAVPDEPLGHEHPGFLAKYADGMARVNGSPEKFSEEYNVAIRVDIGKVRGF